MRRLANSEVDKTNSSTGPVVTGLVTAIPGGTERDIFLPRQLDGIYSLRIQSSRRLSSLFDRTGLEYPAHRPIVGVYYNVT